MLKTIAIAGTFDRLHKGHQFFITHAFQLGRKVIIGLTSDSYVEEKFKSQNSKVKIKVDKSESDKDTPGVAGIQGFPWGGGIKIRVNNYETRKKELEEFLKREKLLDRAQIIKIDDVYGPTLENNDIEALIVTNETLEGAEKVNQKRKEKGMKPLIIYKVALIMAEDQKRIASTRIRIGEIDRLGSVFQSHISENLRQELKKPLGKLIIGDADNLMEIAENLKNAVGRTNSIMISTVGDEVTKLCNEIGITINLAIIDYKVGRKEKYHNLEELGFGLSLRVKRSNLYRSPRDAPSGASLAMTTRVENPPGHISQILVDAVSQSYLNLIKTGKQHIIEVIGEEDLAGVPAILLAPLGSVILYGQPGVGVVLVVVTEQKKQEIMSLINSCI